MTWMQDITVFHVAVMWAFGALVIPNWARMLVKRQAPQWIGKTYIVIKYVAYCVAFYYLLSFVLPEYFSVVITCFLVVSFITNMPVEEKFFLAPQDRGEIIASKRVK